MDPIQNPIPPQPESQLVQPQAAVQPVPIVDARKEKKAAIKRTSIILGCFVIMCFLSIFSDRFSEIYPLGFVLGILSTLSFYGAIITVIILIVNLCRPVSYFISDATRQAYYDNPAYSRNQFIMLEVIFVIFGLLSLSVFMLHGGADIFFGLYWVILAPVLLARAIYFLSIKKTKLAGIYFLAAIAIFIVGIGVCSSTASDFSGL